MTKIFFLVALCMLSCSSSQRFDPMLDDYNPLSVYLDSYFEAQSMVRQMVQAFHRVRPEIAPALVRLHQCLVEGCEESTLHSTNGVDSEGEEAIPSQSLNGFDVIHIIKIKTESLSPGTMSYADVLVLAARESEILCGGAFYPLHTGRRDSPTAFSELPNTNVHAPTNDLSPFSSKNLDEGETVSDKVRSHRWADAFLYFHPPILLTLMVFLWGCNLRSITQHNLLYGRIFGLRGDHHLGYTQIWMCSMWMIGCTLIGIVGYLLMYSYGGISLLFPMSLYVAAPIFLLLPFDWCHRASRCHFLHTLLRVASPRKTVIFAEIFLADILTSLAKVFSDSVCSVCRVSEKLGWSKADTYCGSQSVVAYVVSGIPYLIRVAQCLRRYLSTPDKKNLFNAGKYLSMAPVIIFSGLSHHVKDNRWRTYHFYIWIGFTAINSLYSFCWDIYEDWDWRIWRWTFCTPRVRTQIFRGSPRVFYWFLLSNLVARLSWTVRLQPDCRDSPYVAVLIALVEILRRFQWIFLRVEKEHYIKADEQANEEGEVMRRLFAE